MSQRYLATVSPGFEDALLAEIRQFKTKRTTTITGGVEFEATRRGFYQTLLWSRLANRLYWRFGDFRARDRRDIYKKAYSLAWEEVLPPGTFVRLKAINTKSRLGGTGEIEDAIKDAMFDRLTKLLEREPVKFISGAKANERPEPTTTLLVRCEGNRCTISLEAAGRSMHMRGWRKKTGTAPVRESIASALLNISGWDPAKEVLFDPTCGSGTFAIEAARKVLGKTPRVWDESKYAVESWSNFDAEVWQSQLENAPKPQDATIVACDVDGGVLKFAKKNAKLADVAQATTFMKAANVLEVDPPEAEAGLLISNPPYGERLEREQVYMDLVRRFSGSEYAMWRIGLLLPRDFAIPKSAQASRTWDVVADFRNGGLPVRFWLGTAKAD